MGGCSLCCVCVCVVVLVRGIEQIFSGVLERLLQAKLDFVEANISFQAASECRVKQHHRNENTQHIHKLSEKTTFRCVAEIGSDILKFEPKRPFWHECYQSDISHPSDHSRSL